MAHANRLSRGDVGRNARLNRLRGMVSRDGAVLAVDLADDKQVVVVCDHDSRVLARRTWRCRSWQLGKALGWGLAVACRQGFAGVVVACEPTGHRWPVLVEQAHRLGLAAVCVQPLLVRRAREAEDVTRDKSDDNDALLIARRTTQLHCYLPSSPPRPGRGFGTSATGGSSSSPWRPRPSSACGTCWSAAGRRPWKWRGIPPPAGLGPLCPGGRR
jgi:transposase